MSSAAAVVPLLSAGVSEDQTNSLEIPLDTSLKSTEFGGSAGAQVLISLELFHLPLAASTLLSYGDDQSTQP